MYAFCLDGSRFAEIPDEPKDNALLDSKVTQVKLMENYQSRFPVNCGVQ
jgi:hypothetical protein